MCGISRASKMGALRGQRPFVGLMQTPGRRFRLDDHRGNGIRQSCAASPRLIGRN
jgi:hypothetical protein